MLYGFPPGDERDCFEALIGAHGVGPALGARHPLGAHADGAAAVPADDDLDALTLVPGVGKKTAARLLIELKSRLDAARPRPGRPFDGGGRRRSARPRCGPRSPASGTRPTRSRDVLAVLPPDGEVEALLRERAQAARGRRLAATR